VASTLFTFERSALNGSGAGLSIAPLWNQAGSCRRFPAREPHELPQQTERNQLIGKRCRSTALKSCEEPYEHPDMVPYQTVD